MGHGKSSSWFILSRNRNWSPLDIFMPLWRVCCSQRRYTFFGLSVLFLWTKSHEHRGLHYIWSKCPQRQCRFCSSHLPADNALVLKPAARRGITANKVKAPCSLVILNTFIVKQRHRKRCVFSRSNWTRLLNQQKNTADVLKLNRFRQKLPKYWEAAPVQTRCWRSESLRHWFDATQPNVQEFIQNSNI